MKLLREFIVAEVVILSPEEGGRTIPLPATIYDGCYRPHMVLQSREVREAKVELQNGSKQITDEYLGVAFWKGPHPIPVSTPFTLTLLLMYAPHKAYDAISQGTQFTIREGPKIVGHGKVISRSKEDLI